MEELFLLFRWWFVLEILGFIAFPLVSFIARNLQDKGYCISKSVGLVLLTYFVWIIPSLKLVNYGFSTIVAGLLLLAVTSFYFGRKSLTPDNIPFKSMLRVDLIFLASLLILALILRLKPDLYFAYSEDFMDFAFTNSLLRADYFPPDDPWMAGKPLAYYYGGFLLTANLVKISFVPASFAHNFAVATFFALSAASAYGLASELTRNKIAGLFSVILVCFSGFLSGTFQLTAHLSKHSFMGYKPLLTPGLKDWFLSFNFWDADRIIPGTLNYYPFFSFIQGDMHPPTISFPFQLTFLVLVIALIKTSWTHKPPISEVMITIFVMSISLGFLFFIHSWDYPTYVFALVLAVLLLKKEKIYFLVAGAIILWSVVLFAPYHLGGISKGFQGVGLVSNRTELSSILEMMGVFIFIISSMFFLLAKKVKVPPYQTILLSSLLIMAIPVFKFPLLLILVPIMGLSAFLIVKTDVDKDLKITLFLALIGSAIIFLVDIFHVVDAYKGPLERFNTVFKLYYGAWIFMGLASACGFAYLIKNLKGPLKYSWLFMCCILVLASLVHPLASTTGWTSGRHRIFGINRDTWDGTAYLKSVSLSDYNAIQWINKNLKGHNIILEAPGISYNYSSRVASLTGLSVVIGWSMHEITWRGDWQTVQERTNDVDNIYRTRDINQATGLLNKYGVKYIFMGDLENRKYPAEGLLKFGLRPDLFRLLYDNNSVQVYEVINE